MNSAGKLGPVSRTPTDEEVSHMEVLRPQVVATVLEPTQPDFEQAYRVAGDDIGRVNIVVLGKTGVGKSTLVNAIFGTSVAETGIGRPVTRSSRMYVHANGHLGLIDTQGLEIGKDSAEIINDLRCFVEQRRKEPLAQQPHLAWMCVNAQSGRFEAAEEALVREVVGMGVPVIVVLTQVPTTGNGLHSGARGLISAIEGQALPIVGDAVVPTSAVGDAEMGYGPHGLQELLDRSFRAAPDAVKVALAAAQRIDVESKTKAVKRVIHLATSLATTAGLSPIPGSDAPALVVIQSAMMMKIARIYGIDFDAATTSAMVASASATLLGRTAVSGLLKFIPVANVFAMGLSGVIAGSFTWSMGKAWERLCQSIADGRLDPGALADHELVSSIFLGAAASRCSGRSIEERFSG